MWRGRKEHRPTKREREREGERERERERERESSVPRREREREREREQRPTNNTETIITYQENWCQNISLIAQK